MTLANTREVDCFVIRITLKNDDLLLHHVPLKNIVNVDKNQAMGLMEEYMYAIFEKTNDHGFVRLYTIHSDDQWTKTYQSVKASEILRYQLDDKTFINAKK